MSEWLTHRRDAIKDVPAALKADGAEMARADHRGFNDPSDAALGMWHRMSVLQHLPKDKTERAIWLRGYVDQLDLLLPTEEKT
jgi:hypothetical protein